MSKETIIEALISASKWGSWAYDSKERERQGKINLQDFKKWRREIMEDIYNDYINHADTDSLLSSITRQIGPILPDFDINKPLLMVYVDHEEPFVYTGTGPELLEICKELFPDNWEDSQGSDESFIEWFTNELSRGITCAFYEL